MLSNFSTSSTTFRRLDIQTHNEFCTNSVLKSSRLEVGGVWVCQDQEINAFPFHNAWSQICTSIFDASTCCAVQHHHFSICYPEVQFTSPVVRMDIRSSVVSKTPTTHITHQFPCFLHCKWQLVVRVLLTSLDFCLIPARTALRVRFWTPCTTLLLLRTSFVCSSMLHVGGGTRSERPPSMRQSLYQVPATISPPCNT